MLGSIPTSDVLLRLIDRAPNAEASENVALVARSGVRNGLIALETEGREGTLRLDASYTDLLGGDVMTGNIRLRPYQVLVLQK